MVDKSELTILSLAKRSPGSVMFCTFFFALGGAVFSIISSLISYDAFWGIWIPFCFLSIPALHHLSRELLQTKARLADLEARLNAIQTAEQDADGKYKF
jgi:hypothetical protein